MDRAEIALRCLEMAGAIVASGRGPGNNIYRDAADYLKWVDANSAEPDPKAVDKGRRAA